MGMSRMVVHHSTLRAVLTTVKAGGHYIIWASICLKKLELADEI